MHILLAIFALLKAFILPDMDLYFRIYYDLPAFTAETSLPIFCLFLCLKVILAYAVIGYSLTYGK